MALSQFSIGGGLSFGSAPDLSKGLAGYSSAYQQALNTSQTNYNNVISGYQKTLSQQIAAQNKLIPQYGQLSQQVLGDISNVTASQSQAIKDTYAQQWGNQAQGLINAGLGNTTVQASLQRGLTLDEQKAQVALANQQAQLTAGYRSQLGLAGLGYQASAIQQNSALANQQLQSMANWQIPYPSPGPFMSMYAAQQARGMQGQGGSVSFPGNPYGHLRSGRGTPTAAPYSGPQYGVGGGVYMGPGEGYAESQRILGGNDMAGAEAAGADPYGTFGLTGAGGQISDIGAYDLSSISGINDYGYANFGGDE